MKTSDKPGTPDPGDWDGGWYAGASRFESPNHGPRPADATIDLIVVHSISLPPGEFGGDAVHRLFTNTLDWEAHPYFQTIRGLEVSAHFFIDRSGRLTQRYGGRRRVEVPNTVEGDVSTPRFPRRMRPCGTS